MSVTLAMWDRSWMMICGTFGTRVKYSTIKGKYTQDIKANMLIPAAKSNQLNPSTSARRLCDLDDRFAADPFLVLFRGSAGDVVEIEMTVVVLGVAIVVVWVSVVDALVLA